MKQTPFWEDIEKSNWKIAWSESREGFKDGYVRCIVRPINDKGSSESKIVLDFGEDGYQVYNYNPDGLK